MSETLGQDFKRLQDEVRRGTRLPDVLALSKLTNDPNFANYVVQLELACDQLHGEVQKRDAEITRLKTAIGKLPDARCGSKTGRADYVAIVGGDVLLECGEAANGPLHG